MTKNKQKVILKDTVSVIIVNYKSEKPLHSCLKKICSKSGIKKNLEIIIINNGTENLKLMEKISKFPKLTLIDTNTNLGFAAGVNMGIVTAKNDLILLLNPDTLITLKSINFLIDCLKKNKAGIVGGVNNKFDKGRHDTHVRKPNIFTYLFDYTNLRKITPNDYFHRRHYYLDEPFPVDGKRVDAVSGSFMLINKEVISQIGFFDERYFMYLEDVDYCLRAGKADYEVFFCPKASIKHIGGYSSKNGENTHISAWLESRRRFVMKHESLLTNLIVQPIFLADAIIIKILQKYR